MSVYELRLQPGKTVIGARSFLTQYRRWIQPHRAPNGRDHCRRSARQEHDRNEE